MKIAVIQHRLRGDAIEDASALGAAAASAAARGASLVVLPFVARLIAGDGEGERLLGDALSTVPALILVPRVEAESSALALLAELPAPADGTDVLGTAALAIGDACFDSEQIAVLAAGNPRIAVLSPESQTELQAEAMLEYAIALSDSLSGVIAIAECAGGDSLEPGHGGSAIVVLGEVLAEAFGGDDVLLVDVPMPLPRPEPREPLPSVPPLLAQRLANHRGRLVAEHGPDLS